VKSLHIVHEADIIAKALLSIPRFYVVLLLAVGFALLLIYEVAGEVAKERATALFNQTVTNKIQAELQEPRISNVIVAVSSERAAYLMTHQIQPSIDRFSHGLNSIQSGLSNTQQSAEAKLVEIRSLVEAFSSPTEEVIKGTDLVFRPARGCAMVRLDGIPVAHTTRIVAMGKKGSSIIGGVSEVSHINLVTFNYAGDWTGWTNFTYYVNYVKDPRETSSSLFSSLLHVNSLSFETNALVLNGIRLPFSFFESMEPVMSQFGSVLTNQGLFGIKHVDPGWVPLATDALSKPPPGDSFVQFVNNPELLRLASNLLSRPPLMPTDPPQTLDIDPGWFGIISNTVSMQLSKPRDQLRTDGTNSPVPQQENKSK